MQLIFTFFCIHIILFLSMLLIFVQTADNAAPPLHFAILGRVLGRVTSSENPVIVFWILLLMSSAIIYISRMLRQWTRTWPELLSSSTAPQASQSHDSVPSMVTLTCSVSQVKSHKSGLFRLQSTLRQLFCYSNSPLCSSLHPSSQRERVRNILCPIRQL